MAEPLRILQVVDSLEPGGMENVLAQMVSRMDPSQYTFDICCLTRGGPFEARLPVGTRVHVLGKPAGFSWAAVGALRKLIRGGGFDVIHTRHLGGLIYASLACPRAGRPAVVHSEHTIWDGDELSPKRVWQRRLLYRRAASVFTVSHEQLKQIKSLGLKHKRLSTIVNGVDAARFKPASDRAAIRAKLGLDPSLRWFGMVARFGAQKRHLDLIDAFEQVATSISDVGLLLVGDGGPLKERVLARLSQSPFSGRIHWAGFQQDPVSWYQSMDALVISSANEGFPNAVLEGMACGLPLVANDVCGVCEISGRGDAHGWIGNFDTVPALAVAIMEAARAPATDLGDKGRRGRAHVEAFFSLEAMVKAYAHLYTSL
ncbi:MAG: glycosyltransferase [Verrucomicrobium sp.]